MIKRFYLFFAAFIFLGCVSAYSQISSSVVNGCAPLVGVTFTYSPAAANPVWNFGDGTTSSLPNPTHTFSTPKTYTVTYTASGVSTQSLVINVYGKPTPSFTAITPTKGCIPYPVTFKDNSTGGGGTPITTWQWAYGDGGTNSTNSANQNYIYSVAGQFNVTIKIIDAHGCDSSLTINNMVTVSQKPTISLNTNPNPATACTPPLTVTFTSNGTTSHSPIGNALTYLWTFSGSTSTAATPPAQTYTALGVYPVKIKVTDANNCSDSVTKTVVIQKPTAAFTVPDTVCINATTSFNASASTAGAQTWNYGDGTSGAVNTHTYTASGHYHVKLTVTNGSCSDTVGHNIFVQQPISNFSVTPTYMCSLPKTVSATNSSTPTNGTTYQWSYYQNYTQYSVTPTSYTLTSPTFTLSHLDTNRYTINQLDAKDSIVLTITTAQGCVAKKSLIYIDTVFIPTARFMPDKYQGCVSLTVNFSDSSKFDNPKNPITSWKYLFGDGTSTTLNAAPANTVHTYTAVGIYYPTLIIHTQKGCIDTSYAIKIEVGSKPVASFSVAPSTVCIGDNVTLTNTTPTSYSVDTWHYYGDGGYYASSCTDAQNVTWPFTHATGAQDISLVACFRGCCDSVTQTGAVTVKGPLAKFSVAMDCSTPHVYNFTGNISDAQNWNWDFGDGNVVTNSVASNISHTYAATGDYTVILTAFNAGTGCNPSADTIPVHVRDIHADFKFDTLVCSKIPHSFDASISSDVYTYGNNGYIWLWGDGSSPDITANTATSHSYTTAGSHTVTLIVKDINGCPDTVKKLIKAFSVTPSFTCNPIMCVNSVVSFTNTSVADTAITNFAWDFGDGTATVNTTSATPNPAPHTYNILNNSITSVTVTLTLTSALGCTSSYSTTISISRPNAAFHPTSSINICSGNGVNFASTNSYPNMTWDFGDGTTVGPTPPSTTTSHSFTTSGTYTIALSVIDATGCTDTKTYNQSVNVQNIPQVIITSPAFTSTQLCYPYQAQFTDNSVANIFASRVWDLGNGSTINNNLNSVGTIYQAPGTYTISLTETTTNGCTATLTKTITVVGPVADFTLTPSTICKGQSITFGITTHTDVDTWHWDFGDGTDTTAVSPISHAFNFHPPNGSTNVTLVYWSIDSSCAQTKTHAINIQQVIADFNRNNELTKADTAHCIGSKDVFTNTSVGADTYGWNYGDGSAVNTTVFSPQHQYTVAGTYNVELFIKNNATGCVDTVIKKMIIYPSFSVTATGDTICQGSTGQLTASAAATYSWIPSTNLSSDVISNPTASPSVTTIYTVQAADINGCADTAQATVFVTQPPVPITWSVSIVIGQTVTLPGGQGPGFLYSWSPTTNLSCTTCATPVYSGTVDAHFVETITDVRNCFNNQSTFDVEVKPLASVDVPTAFTPNGDGTNDIVYVAGWGIKSLHYFRIYNRWGELVFESNDIKVGWDGTYKGVPQNLETYVYQVSVETYIGEPLFKKGYIKLIR